MEIQRRAIRAFSGRAAAKALAYLKPGGTIVYATCSILPQENEEQLEYFTTTLGLKLKQPAFSSLPTPGCMDGMFAASLTY